MVPLYEHQKKAIEELQSGNILCGGVGSGKSRTSLAFYIKLFPQNKPDIYIITTAKKRDNKEWEDECSPFKLDMDKVHIDSWNNIKKYSEIKNSFFIFDEQRVVGSGTWVKAFLKIAKSNKWILLSATPGDVWMDYIPVFIANGFYKNRSEFLREHAVFSRWSKFPKVERYISTAKLKRLRNQILVTMDFERTTNQNHIYITTEYDNDFYRQCQKKRWNPYSEKPMMNAAELCYVLRKIVNEDPSRLDEVEKIVSKKKKVIIFYNFNYELEILKSGNYGSKCTIVQWNGQKHEDVPDTDSWVYLVQYAAGSEGWNCIKTDTIIFYSQNYSYKMTHQASGRINRLNTPYQELFYYYLKSNSPIDRSIWIALKNKKSFNESSFIKW